jgi:hypothetical protein
MVSLARQAGIDNILLLTPPPVHDEGRVRHQQQVGPRGGGGGEGGMAKSVP